MKIKRMKIKNFKGFKEFEIDFTSNKNEAEKEIELDFVTLTKDNNHVIPYFNYIIGRNSIGKTTILEAIKFVAKFFANKQIEKATSEVYSKKRIKYMQEFQKTKNKKNHSNLRELWKELKEKIEKEIRNGKHDEAIIKEAMKIHGDEYLEFAKNKKLPIEITIFFDEKKDFFVELIYPIRLEIGHFDFICEPNYNIKNRTDKLMQNFINWAENTFKFTKIEHFLYLDQPNIELYRMLKTLIEEFGQDKKSLNNLNKLVKLADPEFIEFIFGKKSLLRYARKNVKLGLDIETFSLGTKKFLRLLYWILKFAKAKAGILMIDEIENHLHKELVNVIKIGLMEVAIKYDLQVIFTTHNPLLLKEFVVNKQVISLDDSENEDDKIIASKVSSKIKPKNNIIKKYENNMISTFPSPEHAKTISRNIFKKW